MRAFLRRLMQRKPPRDTRGDEALIVSFLAARGPAQCSTICIAMCDHTGGQQEWHFRDKEIYPVLNRLVDEGTLTVHEDRYGRTYALVIDPKLLAKKQP